MTGLLHCLLPHHLLKTWPQQERQQFYRSRKLVGEMNRSQSVHVSVIICGLLRTRLTPQTHKGWKQVQCGLHRGCCPRADELATAAVFQQRRGFTFKRRHPRQATNAGNSSKSEIGLGGYQGLSLPKGDVSPLFILLLLLLGVLPQTPPVIPASPVLCSDCRTNVQP